MKEKKWVFFRVMVYLCLASAIMILSLLIYFKIYRYISLYAVDVVSAIVFSAFSLQIAFNILNIRLIHHYLFNKLVPQITFSVWHAVLLILNACVALALICLFLYGFFETFKTKSYRKTPNPEDITALIIIGTYTFITVYTITGSFILKRYIKYFTILQEEEWLNQLGTK